MDDFQPMQPITTVAQMLGITDRRLRQFVEQGLIPRVERGKVDATWAIHVFAGAKMVEQLTNRPDDPGALVAIAWLTGHGQDANYHRLADTFERNGRNRNDAFVCIGYAQALMSR
jgi:hypothetical protein